MNKIERIALSVEGGHGLTGEGVALLSQALGEPRVYVVALLGDSRSRVGIRDRFMALAFAATQSRDLRP